jgi:hypothetical protein
MEVRMMVLNHAPVGIHGKHYSNNNSVELLVAPLQAVSNWLDSAVTTLAAADLEAVEPEPA